MKNLSGNRYDEQGQVTQDKTVDPSMRPNLDPSVKKAMAAALRSHMPVDRNSVKSAKEESEANGS